MPTIATEIVNGKTTADVEFLGSNFAARREALQKVEAYKRVVEQALYDSVVTLTGVPANMRFRPSDSLGSSYGMWIPCYAVDDDIQTPREGTYTITETDPQRSLAYIRPVENGPEQEDYVLRTPFQNILSIEPLEN